jgi:hypothetical protein
MSIGKHILAFLVIVIVSTILSTIYGIYSYTHLNTVQVVENIQQSPIQPKYTAIIIYLIISWIVFYFVIVIKNFSVLESFTIGFLVSFYSEIGMYSLFTNWPLYNMISDTIYGSFMYGINSIVIKLLFRNTTRTNNNRTYIRLNNRNKIM